jgi:hypothetical protein
MPVDWELPGDEEGLFPFKSGLADQLAPLLRLGINERAELGGRPAIPSGAKR